MVEEKASVKVPFLIETGGDAMPTIAPQKGPQEMFLASSADIAIYGGA